MTKIATPTHSSSPMDDDQRFLSKELCDKIFDRVFSFTDPKYRVIVKATSVWEGNIRWARNRTSLAGNRRCIQVGITLGHQDSRSATVSTNQLDDTSLQAAVHAAERILEMKGGGRMIRDLPLKAPEFTPPEVKIWSDATYNTTNEMRGEIARLLTESAEQHNMLSAGFVQMRAGQIATKFRMIDGQIGDRYDRYTNAECSMTVRHPKGIGSGWAGVSSYDWAAIDGPALASRALDKCVASINPVRIEPGRYTVILESQAVYQLVRYIFHPLIVMRLMNEGNIGGGLYHLGYDSALGLGRSKLGIKIFDERITIHHNISDPEMGMVPVSHHVLPNGEAFLPLLPMTWIERGVLNSLPYGRDYALDKLHDNLPLLWRAGFYMEGGDSSVDEMISTTKRGLLVTRFSNISILDLGSMLCTGITRDGLWLIENGEITKSVHNFRFTDSPFFVLNQVELLGKSTAVYTEAVFTEGDTPEPVFVPPIKVKDFSFTSLVDAI